MNPPSPAARAAFRDCMHHIRELRTALLTLIHHDPGVAAGAFGTIMMNLAHPINGPFKTGLDQLADQARPCDLEGCECHIHCAAMLREVSQHIMPHVTALAQFAENRIAHPGPPPLPPAQNECAHSSHGHGPSGKSHLKQLSQAMIASGTGCQPVGATGSLPVSDAATVPHCRIKATRNDFPIPMWLAAFSEAPGDGSPGLLQFTNKQECAISVPTKQAEEVILPLLRKSCPRVELIPV